MLIFVWKLIDIFVARPHPDVAVCGRSSIGTRENGSDFGYSRVVIAAGVLRGSCTKAQEDVGDTVMQELT